MTKATSVLRSISSLAAGLAITLLGADAQADNGPAARQYLLAKGLHFTQSGPGVPALSTNEPYEGMLSVDPTSSTSISSVSVLIPGGDTVMLATNGYDSEWQAKKSFSTKAALDAEAPSGSYRFTIIGSDGTHMPTLTLTGDTYPNTPRLANWAALQHADASGDIVVTWDAFSGGTTNDFVQFRVEDDMGNRVSSGDNPGQQIGRAHV